MKTWITLGAAALLLLGCAAPKTREIAFTKDAHAGSLVPVKLLMNRNAPIPRFYLDRLSAAEAELANSGLFESIGPDIESDYRLELTLERGTHQSVADAAVHVISAASLFLIPSRVRNFNELQVELYSHGKLAKTYHYRQNYADPLSAFDWTETNEFVSIKNVVRAFMNELEEDRLIPRQRLARTRAG